MGDLSAFTLPFTIVFGVLGPGFLVFGLVSWAIDSSRTYLERVHVVGAIRRWDQEIHRDGDGTSRRFRAEVAYQTPDGQQFRSMARHTSFFTGNRTGQPVDVYYNPLDPSDAVLRLPWLYSGHGASVMFGLIATAIGLAVLLVMPRLFGM